MCPADPAGHRRVRLARASEAAQPGTAGRAVQVWLNSVNGGFDAFWRWADLTIGGYVPAVLVDDEVLQGTLSVPVSASVPLVDGPYGTRVPFADPGSSGRAGQPGRVANPSGWLVLDGRQLRGALYGSAEFWEQNGASLASVTDFVYQRELGRDATAGEQSAVAQQVAAGSSRASVFTALMGTAEVDITAGAAMVERWWARDATLFEAFYVGALLHRGDAEHLVAADLAAGLPLS